MALTSEDSKPQDSTANEREILPEVHQPPDRDQKIRGRASTARDRRDTGHRQSSWHFLPDGWKDRIAGKNDNPPANQFKETGLREYFIS